MDMTFSTCIMKDGMIYFFTDMYNIFSKMDINTGKVEFIREVLSEQELPDNQFNVGASRPIITADNKIYQIGYMNGVLAETGFDIIKWKRYCLDFFTSRNELYVDIKKYKEKIYIISGRKYSIIELDLRTEKIEEIIYDNRAFDLPRQWDICVSKVIMDGNFLWIFMGHEAAVIQFNMEDCDYKKIELPCTIGECYQVTEREQKIYIINKKNKVFEICLETWKEKKLFQIDDDRYRGAAGIVATDKNIIVLPCLDNEIFIWDFKTNKVEQYKEYPEDMRNIVHNGWSRYDGYCEDEAYYYYAARSSDHVLKIDKKKGSLIWIKVFYPEKVEMAGYIMLNDNNLGEESMILGLNELLSMENLMGKKSMCNCIGFKIWENAINTMANRNSRQFK